MLATIIDVQTTAPARGRFCFTSPALYQVQVERDVSVDAVVAVDGDLVGRAGGDVDGDLAGGRAARRIVVVSATWDRGQSRDAGAGVDGEKRVEIAAGGVDRQLAGGGGGPGVPDGFAAGIAGVAGVAGFLGCRLVCGRPGFGCAGDWLADGEVVVGEGGQGAGARNCGAV